MGACGRECIYRYNLSFTNEEIDSLIEKARRRDDIYLNIENNILNDDDSSSYTIIPYEEEVYYCEKYIKKYCRLIKSINYSISSSTSLNKVSSFIESTYNRTVKIHQSSFTQAVINSFGYKAFGFYDYTFYFRISDRNAMRIEKELFGKKRKNYYKLKTYGQE